MGENNARRQRKTKHNTTRDKGDRKQGRGLRVSERTEVINRAENEQEVRKTEDGSRKTGKVQSKQGNRG